jgi:hypothetical protein
MDDRTLALILTILDLLGKPALPAGVEQKYVHFLQIVGTHRQSQK